MGSINRVSSQGLSQLMKSAAAPELDKTLAKEVEQKLLTPEQQAIKTRFEALRQTNAVAVVSAKGLIDDVLAGSIRRPGISLFIDNVDSKVHTSGGSAVLVLSDKGKMTLASSQRDAAMLDIRLKEKLIGATEKRSLDARLDFNQDVDHVILDPYSYDKIMPKFQEQVEAGKAPAMIGGKSYSDFFRKSPSYFSDMEVAHYQRLLPGFAQRPLNEQRAIAALSERVAQDLPKEIPADTRRLVASAQTHHQTYDTPIKTDGMEHVGELMDFFHGRHIEHHTPGKILRPPEALLDEGFHPDKDGRFGAGVYWAADPHTTKQYGYTNAKKGASIVSGKVAIGKMVRAKEGEGELFTKQHHSRWVPNPFGEGDYYLTRDPKRLFITGITRYDPSRQEGFEKLIPQLLDAYPKNPQWVSGMLERVDPEIARRAYLHARKNGTPEMRRAATLLLAERGDSNAIKTVTEAFDTAVKSDHGKMLAVLAKGIPLLDNAARQDLTGTIGSLLPRFDEQQLLKLAPLLAETHADHLLTHAPLTVQIRTKLALLEKQDPRGTQVIDTHGSKSGAEPVIRDWLKELDPQRMAIVQPQAMAALSKLSDSTVVELLPHLTKTHGTALHEALLAHPRDLVRKKSGILLMEQDPQRAFPQALEAMKGNWNGADVAIRQWLRRVDTTHSPELATNVAQALDHMPEILIDTHVHDLLSRNGGTIEEALLGHSRAAVRRHASLRLLQAGDERGVAGSIEALNSQAGGSAVNLLNAWLKGLRPTDVERVKPLVASLLDEVGPSGAERLLPPLMAIEGSPFAAMVREHPKRGIRKYAPHDENEGIMSGLRRLFS